MNASITLEEYSRRIKHTDNLDSIRLLKFGLFGEVGSVLTTAKKHKRDGMAFHYRTAITEELGDVLWYLIRIIDVFEYKLTTIIKQKKFRPQHRQILPTAHPLNPIAIVCPTRDRQLKVALSELGQRAAQILNCKTKCPTTKARLQNFAASYLETVQATNISFPEILTFNIEKTEGRFMQPTNSSLINFDKDFPKDERLPTKFKIKINERKNGKTYLKLNGVFVGDPLTDNIKDSDGYRFHDVFHMANAAILHWSPTFRSLIKHKRKSDLLVDETQDSGRAIVIEEGLSAWIFSIAKKSNYFEGQNRLSFDVLKNIQHFVAGYEVEKCPLRLWEKAILDSYKVFRKLKKHNGGIVIGNRNKRTLRYKHLE